MKSHSILYFSHSIHHCLWLVPVPLFVHFYSIFFTYFPINLCSKPIMSSFILLFGLTCQICLSHDLHSSGFQHILNLRFSWVLSIIALMLLGRIACSYAAVIKVSVVLFKHPFLSHPHQSSLILPVICLINCPCNCFCVHCVFLSFFPPFFIFIFFCCTCSN